MRSLDFITARRFGNILFTILFFTTATYFAPSVSARQTDSRTKGSAHHIVKVACIGNSITYGTSLSNPAEESYPSQLQLMLGDNYMVGNFGKPGATLLEKGHRPYILQEEFKKAMDFKGDIAVIHLGINDTDPRDWPDYGDEFINDYIHLIDTLKYSNRDLRVIIARMTPIRSDHPRFNSGTRQWYDNIQKAIETVAGITGCELIDFNAPFITRPDLFNDSLHPSAEGARIMAGTVYSAITGDYGGLRLPIYYSDNMVIQMNQPIYVTGTADSGEKVTVVFAGQKAVSTANCRGEWSVTLPSVNEGRTNLTLTVSAKSRSYSFKNVCTGEVWLCSGQSNMQFQLKHASTASRDIQNARDPMLRFFNMTSDCATTNVEWTEAQCDSVKAGKLFNETKWAECSPESAGEFSAIAYYYGKVLRDSLDVPVGLINNSIGGTGQESWIDRKTLEDNLSQILQNWTGNDFIMQWSRERAIRNAAKSRSKWLHHPFEPCYMFDTGIRPLAGCRIKGVVWYQGESNAHCCETYEVLFQLFAESWRKWWNNENLPIYYVQLSSLNRPSWCRFRDCQRRLMDKVSNTGMVVSLDYGNPDDVHPKDKIEIGQRLARWALSQQYGRTCTPSGPLVKCATAGSSSISVEFCYSEGLKASDGKELRGFEVAENDGQFYPATATLDGNRIILRSNQVRTIRFVRYGWKPYTDANLVNADNLPASTFRIEVTGFSR